MKRKKYLKPDVEMTIDWFTNVLNASDVNGMGFEENKDGQYFDDFFKPKN